MSARNFYIMQSAVAPMQSELPCYTPLTNHRTELHTVPMVMAADYAALEAENAALKHRCGMLGLELENAEERRIQAERQAAILRQHKADYMEAAEETRRALEAECERLADELDRKSVITGDYIARYQRIADERDALRQQLADVFEGNTKLHVLWTEAVRQRDKLAEVLGNVEREHDLIRRMKNCEIQRGRGSFGIAVMSDQSALEWQALDKELQQFVDARRAALSELTQCPS